MMPETTETWTTEEYAEFKRTGKEPERFQKGLSTPSAGKEPQKPSKADIQAEKDLQTICENWLTQHGYVRLTADNAVRENKDRTPGFRGWFGHLNKPKGNPFLPDLMLFDRRGWYLFIELKVRDVWQKGQKEMTMMMDWSVAWNFADFERMVLDWEEDAG
jgi:hypothetical protein